MKINTDVVFLPSMSLDVIHVNVINEFVLRFASKKNYKIGFCTWLVDVTFLSLCIKVNTFETLEFYLPSPFTSPTAFSPVSQNDSFPSNSFSLKSLIETGNKKLSQYLLIVDVTFNNITNE